MPLGSLTPTSDRKMLPDRVAKVPKANTTNKKLFHRLICDNNYKVLRFQTNSDFDAKTLRKQDVIENIGQYVAKLLFESGDLTVKPDGIKFVCCKGKGPLSDAVDGKTKFTGYPALASWAHQNGVFETNVIGTKEGVEFLKEIGIDKDQYRSMFNRKHFLSSPGKASSSSPGKASPGRSRMDSMMENTEDVETVGSELECDEETVSGEPPVKKHRRRKSKSGYHLFFSETFKQLKESSDADTSDVGETTRLIRDAWVELPDSQKACYDKKASGQDVMSPIRENGSSLEVTPQSSERAMGSAPNSDSSSTASLENCAGYVLARAGKSTDLNGASNSSNLASSNDKEKKLTPLPKSRNEKEVRIVPLQNGKASMGTKIAQSVGAGSFDNVKMDEFLQIYNEIRTKLCDAKTENEGQFYRHIKHCLAFEYKAQHFVLRENIKKIQDLRACFDSTLILLTDPGNDEDDICAFDACIESIIERCKQEITTPEGSFV